MKDNMSPDKSLNYQYLNFSNHKDLIEGVVLRKLIIRKDPTGSLVETLRYDWPDVFSQKDLPFAMQYFSQTPSGIVRDENEWHVHKYQEDRFVCISGRIVVAVYDPRENSATSGKLNLFLIGPGKEQEMFMVVIPRKTYHGFMVISAEPGYLLNFPTQLYNPKDEGRIPNEHLNWNKVREDFS